MPLFNWKKKEPPKSPYPYPEELHPLVLAINAELKTLFDNEAAALKALKLPVPQNQPVIKVEIPHGQPLFKMPAFDLPTYSLFIVRDLKHIFYRSVGFTMDKCLYPYLVYVIAGTPEQLEKVQETFKTAGLPVVIKNYAGVWCNRDPYSLYKKTTQQKSLESHYYDTSKSGHRPAMWTFPPLQQQQGYAPAEAEQIEQWCYFIASILKTYVHTYLEGLYTHRPLAPEISSLLFDIPLTKYRFQEPNTALKILPAAENKATISKQFLDSLRAVSKPLCFEIVAEQDCLHFQLSFAPEERELIERQLKTYFPDFTLIETTALPTVAQPLYFFEASANQPFAAFKNTSQFTIDPYAQLFSILEQTPATDTVYTQFLFAPLKELLDSINAYLLEKDKWGESLERWKKQIKDKLPAWIGAVKFFSTNEGILERIKGGFLQQYETPEATWKLSQIQPCAAINRKLSTLNLLSTAELATLVHFPYTECERLETASMKSKLPPESYTKNGIHIGQSEARGQSKPVVIPFSVRDRHVYVVGKSGTGKSTLLYNCICQDIASGSGVAVIDPHGDLIEDVLKFIPENRIEDTIYFNAGDKEYPISLNILNAENEDEIGLLADDLLVTFKRISESWGERMDTILRYTFHTMLRVPDSTLLDIPGLFQNPSYRQQALSTIQTPLLLDFWENQYPNYPRDAAQPILNRLAKFALSPILSGILGQGSSNLNFFDVIQNKKILLVNLSKGIIGEDSAQLLGSLIVSQLQLAVMRRAALPKETREPYFLYVDEFQNFTTSAFEKILSEARKYKLCLTLAHQYISQLDEKTKNAILANVGTIVMFQSYPADASALRPELGQYEPTDVTNLNTAEHEALCKPATQSRDTFKFKTLAPLPTGESFAKEIIEFTQENYSEGPRATPEAAKGQPEASPAQAQERKRSEAKQPVKALAKEFASAQDKILYYVSQAEWLATPQIISLCYGHLSESAKKPVASRDLKALTEAKRLKSQVFGSGKIYYSGRACNPTNHNRAIRELYTKVVSSGYEIAEVSFFPDLKTLRPDLAISFLAEDGSFIKSFWEYDAGTEDVADLVKKVSQYGRLAPDSLICFVFNSEERQRQVNRTIKDDLIIFAVLDQFETLDDASFRFASDESGTRPFFSL